MDTRIKPIVEMVQEAIIAACAPWANGLNVNVSVGRKDNPSTWRIDFAEDVTPQQRQQALNFLATLSPADFAVQPPRSNLEARLAQMEADITVLRNRLDALTPGPG